MKNLQKLVVLASLLWIGMITATAQIKIGVCTNIQNAQKAKDAGAQFIEESVGRFLMPDKSDAEFASNLAAAKASPLPILSCNGFMPGSIKVTGPNADHEAALKWAETAFRRAQQAGISRIVFGSGGARQIPEGFSYKEATKQFVSLLKKMGPIAAKYNVIVVLEPLRSAECNFLNTVGEGVQIVKKVNHPNIQCLADIYHMMQENEGPEAILKGGKYLKHCHVAEKMDRAAPGTNGEDLTPYYNALHQIGYQGGLSIECSWKDFDKQLAPALANLKKYAVQKNNALNFYV